MSVTGTKRARSFKSCSACRQRKIKCDKQKPVCGTCVRRKKTHLCHYDDQEWAVVNLANDDAELDSTTVDFYLDVDATPVVMTHGPLSWASLLSKDLYLTIIKLPNIANNNRIMEQPSSSLSLGENRSSMCSWLANHLVDDNISHNVFIETLKSLISDGKLIWLLVDDFFTSEFYTLMPYILRKDFEEKLEKLIGPRSDNKINLRLTKTIELATVGILLLIMRISYISKYNFNKPLHYEDEKTKYILSHPTITKDHTTKLLRRLDLELLHVQDAKLEVFQYLIFKHSYYESYAPESTCFDVSSDISDFAILLNYARKCLLDRDPGNYNNIFSSETQNLRRRLWFCLVNMDLSLYLRLGYVNIIQENCYDTKLPSSNREGSTSIDKITDEWIVQKFRSHKRMKTILDSMLDMKKKCKLGELKKMIMILEEHISCLRTIETIVSQKDINFGDRCKNIQDFINWIDYYTLYFMMNYQLFLHFNFFKNKEKSIQYYLKLLEIAKIIYKTLNFIDSNKTSDYNFQRIFGSGVIIFPKIDVLLHKIFQLNFSTLSRIKLLKLKQRRGCDKSNSLAKPLTPDMIKVLNKLTLLMSEIITYSLGSFVKISDFYYHVWTTTKIQISMITNVLKYDPKSLKDGALIKELNSTSNSSSDLSDRSEDFFTKLIEGSKLFDSGFEEYNLQDITNIYNSYSKICDSFSTFPENCEWNTTVILKNDKIWLKQMMSDYSDQNQLLEIFNESSRSKSDGLESSDDVDIIPTQPSLTQSQPSQPIQQNQPSQSVQAVPISDILGISDDIISGVPGSIINVSSETAATDFNEILPNGRTVYENLNMIINANVDLTNYSNIFNDTEDVNNLFADQPSGSQWL